MEPIIGTGTNEAAAEALIKESDAGNFVQDVVQGSQERPVIVDFWAEWCGPCKQLTPILEKVVREQKGKVALIKLDVDKNQQIAAQLRIQSIPAVYAFYQGQPMDAFQGALPESQVRQFVEKLIENAGLGRSPVDTLIDKGEDALASGDADTAFEIFRQALSAEPDHPGLLGGMVQALLALGRREEAERMLAELPEDKADHPQVAKARAALELTADASEVGDVAALRERVAASPDDLEARFDLANAELARDDREAAAEQLVEILRRDRQWNDGAARQRLLKMFEAAGPADPFTLRWRRRLSSILFA